MTDWDKIWNGAGGAKVGAPEISFVRFAARVFGPRMPSCRFLDIGSGTGANTLWLEQHGADVVAIDPSHKCRAHYHESCAVYLEEYCPEPFDCILDIKTLCHTRLYADYRDIHAFLKPGGWLYVMAPTIHHLRTEGGYRDVGHGKDYTRYASEWEMRSMLSMFSSVTIRELQEPAGSHLYTSTWCCEAQK